MAKRTEAGKKILIIEDDEILGAILLKKFLHDGFAATLARDGEQGVNAIRARQPDLVLLDILMPKLDGYQVLETMNRDGSINTTPVIIISNSGQPVELDRARRLGAKDFLIKTQFSPEAVMAKVRRQLDQAAAPRPAPRHQRKILMVEDDAFLRDLAVKKFRRAGYAVAAAVNGVEAVSVAVREKPDVILLDIILPGVDGFEVLRNLKADPKLKAIPVIILSNLGQESDIARGTALGAAEYLVKAHFTLDEILEKVRKYAA